MKNPFTFKFKDGSVVEIDKKKYQGNNGIMHKTHKRDILYLFRYFPEKLREFMVHHRKFNHTFNKMDSKLKK